MTKSWNYSVKAEEIDQDVYKDSQSNITQLPTKSTINKALVAYKKEQARKKAQAWAAKTYPSSTQKIKTSSGPKKDTRQQASDTDQLIAKLESRRKELVSELNDIDTTLTVIKRNR